MVSWVNILIVRCAPCPMILELLLENNQNSSDKTFTMSILRKTQALNLLPIATSKDIENITVNTEIIWHGHLSCQQASEVLYGNKGPKKFPLANRVKKDCWDVLC